jgi:hypothetical protein
MRKLLIAALLLSTSGANAGWFGPSDYRECVLNEMKGQSANLLPTVKGLCDKRFPCPLPTQRSFESCDKLSDPTIDPRYGLDARGICYLLAARIACGDNRD